MLTLITRHEENTHCFWKMTKNNTDSSKVCYYNTSSPRTRACSRHHSHGQASWLAQPVVCTSSISIYCEMLPEPRRATSQFTPPLHIHTKKGGSKTKQAKSMQRLLRDPTYQEHMSCQRQKKNMFFKTSKKRQKKMTKKNDKKKRQK